MATYLKRVRAKSLCTQANGDVCYFNHSMCMCPVGIYCPDGTCFRLATKREIAAWKKRHGEVKG